MDFKPPLSLKHMTCAKIAVSLWSHDYLMQSAARYKPTKFRGLETEWRLPEDKVIENAQTLTLPKTVKEQLIPFIGGVGREILHWCHFHEPLNVIELPDKFVWTNTGTIDRKRTAELMVKDETLDIRKRYRLACTYCLIEHICLLFDEVEHTPDEFEIAMENRPVLMFWQHCSTEDGLEAYLTAVRSGNPVSSSLSTNGFAISTLSGSIDAAKFSYQVESQKLYSNDLKDMAIKLAKKPFELDGYLPQKHYADIFCSLLSVLNEEEQMQVFKCAPFETSRFLLNWPWQEHFVKALPRIWSFFSQQDYQQLLQLLLENATMGYRDFCYKDIFKECWQKIRQADKHAIINKGFLRHVLHDLFYLADLQLIDMIFHDVTVSQSATLFFTARSSTLCLKLLKKQDYDLLAYYVTKCLRDSEYCLQQAISDGNILRRMSLDYYRYSFNPEQRAMALLFLLKLWEFQEEFIHDEVSGTLAQYLKAKQSVLNCFESWSVFGC